MPHRFLFPLLCIMLILGSNLSAAGTDPAPASLHGLRPLSSLPEAGATPLMAAPHSRVPFSRAGDPHRASRPIQEKDFTAELDLETGPVHHLTPEEQALVAALGDPT